MKQDMKITLLILFISCTAAFARLGESNKEIMARYGAVRKRTETGTNTWRGGYVFKEYKVAVDFRDNKSECESFYFMKDGKMNDDERNALLKLSGGDGDWEFKEIPHGLPTWVNSKNGAVGFIKNDGNEHSILVVTSMEYAQRSMAKKKAEGKSETN
jgi:hypothetical protein